MYHIVAVVKYRKPLLSDEISVFLKDSCIEISKRFEIRFLEIGTDNDHVHFLIQSIPTLSISKVVQLIKGNLSRQIFLKFPEVKKELWGGEFWTDGYYANTVSQYGGRKTIERYIQNQGKTKKLKSEYKKLHEETQTNLFEEM